jgi:DNA-binding NarL/FixJ family response regulator
MNKRVLIATNEPMLAKGVEATLLAGSIEVCATCTDVFELFDCFVRSRPDIVILDLPVLPEPEVIRELRRLSPHCQFLIWPRPILRRGTEEAVRYGARALPSYAAAPGRLTEVLSLLLSFPEPERGPADMVRSECSGVERECIAMVGHGLTNQEIAAAMGSDESTVHELLKRVSTRLGIEDRYELALYGLSALEELPMQGEHHG